MSESRQGVLFEVNGVGSVSCGKRYWLTPPDLYAALDAEFGFDCDPCPFPLPEGFNGLELEWGGVNYVNPPFRPQHVIGGSGPTAFVTKALEQQRLGKTSVLVLPVRWYTDMLFRAGAECRALGRVRWRECGSGDPMPNPGPVALFVLRGHATEGDSCCERS